MPELRPSQKKALAALDGETLLIADMGTGKTAIALRAVAHRPGRALVVSTVRICRDVWPTEAALWTPGCTYANAAGLSPAKRQEAIEGRTQLIGINFENLPWLVKTYPDLTTRFRSLVIDESSRLENPGSKAFSAIKPLLKRFEFRLPMTGSPRANHLQDLWAHAYLADCGRALGCYRETYRQTYFRSRTTPFGETHTPKPGAEDEIYERLAACSYRLVFDGDKPETVIIDVQCDIAITRSEATKMRQTQLASGAIYEADGSTTILHDAKVKALEDLTSQNVVVVYNYKHELERLITAFPQATPLTGAKEVEAWNRGEIEMLLLHPKSAGHGLNIQHGGSVMIWFSPPPTVDAELFEQTNARLARPGQKDPLVRIYRLLAGDDASTYKAIEDKLAAQRALTDKPLPATT